jgi:CHAT domain-containing protein
VASLREEIRTDSDEPARDDLSHLYKVLIQPLVMHGLKLEDYDRLIIVPHGPLHYVPFAALLDDQGKFLVEKTAVTIVPSASVWLLLQARSSPAIGNFVAFGNPLLKRSDLPSLEAAESEVNHIADELDIPGADAKHVFIREQATEERFLRESPGASLLHLATHGEFPDENALDRHAVLLAAGKSDDGVLSASAIRKLNLVPNRLVVLSVCDGGLYRIGPADEPYGLIPAFLQAGSRNAIGTLWKVEDIYGRLLMTEFYKSLLQVGPAEALRRASKEFIGQSQTISRWSGFVSVGSGRPFQ